MSDKIWKTLRELLKSLNPYMKLKEINQYQSEVHQVRWWLNHLHPTDLKKDASLDQNIYREGKFDINVNIDDPPFRIWFEEV